MFDRNKTVVAAPIELSANLIPRFYRGGPRIAAFRELTEVGDHQSEDWVGSATHTRASDEIGLSHLPDGRLFRDVLEHESRSFLGENHVARYGANPGLLVKLLDAGERLPVHCHPSREFAEKHLGSPFGKTEAWHVLRADAGACVYVGFREEADFDELTELVSEQPPAALLSRLNPIAVAEGDTIFVPGGVPHSIGEGLLIVEVQEPTDQSVILEWNGFAIDGANIGHLRLGFDVALRAVDRTAWDAERLSSLRVAPGEHAARRALLPNAARPFFWLEQLRPDPDVVLEPAFSVLIVTRGEGAIAWGESERTPMKAGQTFLIPYDSGVITVTGAVEILRCLAPASAHDAKE